MSDALPSPTTFGGSATVLADRAPGAREEVSCAPRTPGRDSGPRGPVRQARRRG
ncbi:hypothetical protein ACIPSE_41490 [Streptomyces sp. NPDC090106]|uniref:hypothetical protein n=1 Tax=Streptomyces sp. NPDC090106 TaxID=3365946 RepID=UPI00382E762B